MKLRRETPRRGCLDLVKWITCVLSVLPVLSTRPFHDFCGAVVLCILSRNLATVHFYVTIERNWVWECRRERWSKDDHSELITGLYLGVVWCVRGCQGRCSAMIALLACVQQSVKPINNDDTCQWSAAAAAAAGLTAGRRDRRVRDPLANAARTAPLTHRGEMSRWGVSESQNSTPLSIVVLDHTASGRMTGLSSWIRRQSTYW